jgi:hypothetical protein
VLESLPDPWVGALIRRGKCQFNICQALNMWIGRAVINNQQYAMLLKLKMIIQLVTQDSKREEVI